VEILRSIPELKAWRARQAQSVGFVPTMGALHEGHASLLKRARAEVAVVVLSIFVNPAQFGPNEDYARYPRTWEKDLEIARAHGVDAVFSPSADEVYAPGYSTFIEETQFSAPLCGEFRPGHFRGVATIVFRLFQWVRPERAYFGMKDAQQFFVLSKMVKDLDLSVEMVGCETVREPSGLALSSRNRYLSPEDSLRAPLIYRELSVLRDQAMRGEQIDLDSAHARLTSAGFRVQYLEARRLSDFSLDRPAPGEKFLIAIAAFLGTTRLIDNVRV